jgi:hypothetical protein
MKVVGFFLIFTLVFVPCLSFYLPGVAPVEYEDGAQVDLKVNKLTSVHTQLPYKYYYLPFCTPAAVEDKVENLGEILRGDRIENSLYKVKLFPLFPLDNVLFHPTDCCWTIFGLCCVMYERLCTSRCQTVLGDGWI